MVMRILSQINIAFVTSFIIASGSHRHLAKFVWVTCVSLIV